MTKAEATAKWRKKYKMLNKHTGHRKGMMPAEKEYLRLKEGKNERTVR